MDRAAVAFSWIDKIERAATPTAVLREMAHAAPDFGLDHLIVAGIPAPSRKLAPYTTMLETRGIHPPVLNQNLEVPARVA
jgi:hypothetical protein